MRFPNSLRHFTLLGGKVVSENYAQFLIHILIVNTNENHIPDPDKQFVFLRGNHIIKVTGHFFFRLKSETKLAGINNSYIQLHHVVYNRGRDYIIHSEILKQLY